MAKAHSKQRRKVDWLAIKQAYLEGQPVEVIAEAHGVAPGTIYNRSSMEQWPANLPELDLGKLVLEKIVQRKAAKAGLSTQDAQALEIEERAIGLEIIRHHIVQAERIHGVMAGILESVIRDPDNITPDKLERLHTLQQASGIITTNTGRLAALRRQAWQLDRDDSSTDQSKIVCSKRLDEIYARGMEISRQRELTIAGRSARMAAMSERMYPSSQGAPGG